MRKPAMVFAEPNFEDVVARFHPNDSDPSLPRAYNTSDLEYANMSDNWISSVMVPVGYTLTLFADDG